MPTPRRKILSAPKESLANRERKKPVPKLPLDLLKKALGYKNATLLEYIPLDKIEWVAFTPGPKSNYLLSHKIRVGNILDEQGTSQALWAYMNKQARGEGLPELWFFGSHPVQGDFCPWASSVVSSKAELREEFKVWEKKKYLLPVVLKVAESLCASVVFSTLTINRRASYSKAQSSH
jgi:hypothetical protein